MSISLIRKFAFAILILAASVPLPGISATTISLTGGSGFFNVDPQSTPAHSAAELNQIFLTGVGPYATNMKDKLYPYPLPRNSVFNAPLYNGCYDSNNNRLGDLNTALNCNAVIASHPKVPIFRLFLGYKIGCLGTIDPSGNCQDTALNMNCLLTQVADTSGALSAPILVRECSTGNPIFHKAKANSDDAKAFIGCPAGTDGTTYPTCTMCGNGTYNDVLDMNLSPCKACSVMAMTGSPTMPNAATQPTLFDTHSYSGNTAGMISGASCWIADGRGANPIDPWTCAPGYMKTSDNQVCVPQGSCSLSFSIIPTNPTSASASDGQIIATYSGQVGTVSAFGIISPSLIAPNPVVGTTGTFSGLAAGTYKVSATDSSCTSSTNITLGGPGPGCTLSIAPGTINAPTTAGGTNGSFSVSVSGASSAPTFTVSPTGPALVTSGISYGVFSGASAGNYTVTAAAAGCTSASTTITVPSGAGCNLSIYQQGGGSPPSTLGGNGSFALNWNNSFTTPPTGFTTSPAGAGPFTSGSNFAVFSRPSGSYTMTGTYNSGACSFSIPVTVPPYQPSPVLCSDQTCPAGKSLVLFGSANTLGIYAANYAGQSTLQGNTTCVMDSTHDPYCMCGTSTTPTIGFMPVCTTVSASPQFNYYMEAGNSCSPGY